MTPQDNTNDNEQDGSVRTFGVEEELLLVDAVTLSPLPAGERAVPLDQQDTPSGHEITVELKQEQIEVASPPQTTLAGQLETIRAGRALAEAAAARVGGRVVALPTAPGPVTPHLVPDPRYRRISEQFGLTADEQLTCGFHIHVQVNSREEGVAVLDRIRVWLPALLALSANSPFWHGMDTGFASYRYQVWNRWPTAGPTDVFGSTDVYDQQVEALVESGVLLDQGMVYFDARLSARFPTIEVRIADVCLDARHAAVLAAVIRALVETASRQWRSGIAPQAVPAMQLRAWAWQASRSGVDGPLVDPLTAHPCPAGDAVARLLDLIRPVLIELEEETAVENIITEILRHGPGARRQREAYEHSQDLAGIIRTATQLTHQRPR